MSEEVIGVHIGKFHTDDALCCALLKMLPEYKNARILRSSDIPVLEKECTIICDVGGVYDHSLKRYDHHQRGFNERFTPDSKILHAAVGLVYRHYGKRAICEIAKKYDVPILTEEPASDDAIFDVTHPVPLSPSGLNQCYEKIYWEFIAPIDANDNGISQYPSGAKPLYVDITTLASRVNRLNIQWNVKGNDQLVYERFLQAVELAGKEFEEYVRFVLLCSYPAQKLVRRAYENRYAFHPSGSIMFVEEGAPWEDTLDDIEDEIKQRDKSSDAKKEQEKNATVYYVLTYSRLRNSYNATCVSVDHKSGSFVSRRPFPKAWRGLRDAELTTLCKVPGSRFVHASGFLAVNDTLEGAKRMAEIALEAE